MARVQLERPRVALRRLLVPLVGAEDDALVVAEACALAADGGTLVALVALEVPRRLPLAVPLAREEAQARAAVAHARDIASRYGVHLRPRIVRTRAAGPTIVAEAERANCDAIVVRMRRGSRLDAVAEHVLRHARCRVLVAAG